MLSFEFLKKHLMTDLSDFMSSYAQEMSNSSKMSEMSNYEGNQEQNDEIRTFNKVTGFRHMTEMMSFLHVGKIWGTQARNLWKQASLQMSIK